MSENAGILVGIPSSVGRDIPYRPDAGPTGGLSH